MLSQLPTATSTEITVVISVRNIRRAAASAAAATPTATGETPVGKAKRLLPSLVALRAVSRRSRRRSGTRRLAVAHVDGVLYDIELIRASTARSIGPGMGLFSARKRTWTNRGHGTHGHTREDAQHRNHGAHRRRQDDDDRAHPLLHGTHPQDG